MIFHSYRVVFCAPIPTGPRTPDFGSCSMSYERQMNLSYMVLLDMWNMFG